MTAESQSPSGVRVDAPQQRTTHRLRCVYTLSGVEATQHGDAAWEKLDMGRFVDHYREAGESLPGLVSMATLPSSGFAFVKETPGVKIEAVTTYVFSVPNSDPVAALEVDFTGDVLQVIPLLRETCFERGDLEILVGGEPRSLFDAILVTASPDRLDVRPNACFGRDVHQLFMPAGSSAELLATAEDGAPAPDLDRLARIVYRADDQYRLEYAAIKIPKELNRPSLAVAGHARGVTVLAGNAAHVENAAFIVAVQLLSAAARLRRISRDAREALAVLDTTVKQTGDLETRRGVLSSLGTELSKLQVQLSFGVEANSMPLHVPEVVLEHYQASLADSLGLDSGCDVVSKMLDRLSIAMTATAGSLLAIEQQRDNGRRQRWVIAIGWLSTAAIPLAIVFGFFGMSAREINADLSFINGHYALFYVLLAALVVTSFLLFLWLKSSGDRERERLEELSAQPLSEVVAQLRRSN